jgi:deoxyhypusine synthase
VDSTVAFPLLVHYTMAKCKPRKLKRLYDKREKIMALMEEEYWKNNKTF